MATEGKQYKKTAKEADTSYKTTEAMGTAGKQRKQQKQFNISGCDSNNSSSSSTNVQQKLRQLYFVTEAVVLALAAP